MRQSRFVDARSGRPCAGSPKGGHMKTGKRKGGQGGGGRARWMLVVALTFLVTALSVPAALANPILVYTGGSPLNEGYTQFGAAVGDPVVESPVLPADLTPYDCVVLPVNSQLFDAGQKATFASYLASGGRLFALGDGWNSSRPPTRR